MYRELDHILSSTGGTVSICISAVDTTTGLRLERGADERLPAASIIKLLILVELFTRVENGQLDLLEKLTVEKMSHTPGSGVLNQLAPGHAFSLGELAHLMITVSDNTASNMLIDLLGVEPINDRARALGLPQTSLQRKFYDFEARDRGCENWTSAGDVTRLLSLVAAGQAAGAAMDHAMIQILKKQQFDGRIPRALPAGVTAANKTGTISGVAHDAAIIEPGESPIVMTILTSGYAEQWQAEEAIRRSARLLFDLWRPQPESP